MCVRFVVEACIYITKYVLNQNAHCNILRANFCTYICELTEDFMSSELIVIFACHGKGVLPHP